MLGLLWPLVGRERELDQISAAQAEGRGAVVVHGPAGVGKSRLAREALAAAEREGSAVVSVQATASAAAVPLGAFAGELPPDVRSDDLFELLRKGVVALRLRADSAPLVLAVDDAHLLDPVSAALVLQIATTAEAFVVATVRSGEICPDAIVSLWKDGIAQRLELDLLDEEETGTLVERMAAGPVESAARRWAFETSRGNALYVRELVLGAIDSGSLEEVNGLWRLSSKGGPVSPSLIDLVTERMSGLTAAETQAIELLALGEPLRLSELVALVGDEPLVSLEARGISSIESGQTNARISLSHPLYGEVVRTNLPTLRGREVRLQLAEAIQARGSLEPEESMQVAHLLLDVGEPIATELLLDAARASILAGDSEFGSTLASQALASEGGIEASLVLARAEAVRGRFEEALAVLVEAEGGIETQAQALEFLDRQSEVLHWGLKRPGELRQLLDRADSWWPEPSWAQRLEALRLQVRSFERLGTPGVAEAEPLESEELDQETRAQLQPLRVANLFYAGRAAEALELAREIRPEPPLRSLSEAIALSLWSRITLETGEDWDELEAWMTSALAQGVRLENPATAGQAAYSLACLCDAAGHYRRAQAMLAEAEAQFERHDPVGLLVVVDAMQVEVARFTGEAAAAAAALERCRGRLDGAPPLAHQLPYVARAEAWAADLEGDPPRAQRLLLEAAEQMSNSPVHAARLTYEATRAGATGRRQAEQLERLAEECDALLVQLCARHASARAAGDGKAAIAVVEGFEQVGALRFASEAAADAADAFAREGREDSARRAAARSRELHASGEGGTAPPIGAMDGASVELTAREAQLVGLAGNGLSNAEIADRLVLSVRTVESHLYRAMQKLGVSDRHEL